LSGRGRPLIGVSPWLEHVRWEGFQDRVAFAELSFLERLDAVGASAVIVPPQAVGCPQLLDALDGVLLAGGPDLFVEVDGVRRERDDSELALARWALASKVPVLGVCRGCEVLNVAAGGTLVTEIEERFAGVRHQVPRVDEGRPFEFARHQVEAEPGGDLDRIVGSCFEVLSSHHQAVAEPAPGFAVAGRSPDGLVEAISAEAHPFALGVQWHPEAGPDQSLFRALVAAASERRAKGA
jgi:putative glutamine amidotransferase